MYGYRLNSHIGSFADIERRYAQIVPIRGTTCRPIDNRRVKTMEIIKHSDDSYSCRYYNTDCVTYFRDGTIQVQCGGWQSQSTKDFIDACLPAPYSARMVHSAIHIADRNAIKEYRLGSTPITIKDGVFTGAVPNYKQLVDKPATKLSRAKYMPFIAFAKSFMVTLGMEVPRPDDNSSIWHSNKFICNPELYTEDDYLDILGEFAYMRWYKSTPSKTFKQIKNMLYRIGTVYRPVELPIGEI